MKGGVGEKHAREEERQAHASDEGTAGGGGGRVAENVTRTPVLRVASLNCWGLPDRITRHIYKASLHMDDDLRQLNEELPERSERIRRIGTRLADFDVIAFQELWMPADRTMLEKAGVEAGLVHCKYFPSTMIGSGLMMLSRFPIIESEFHKYSINGKPQRLQHGDYQAGKGVAKIRIHHPTARTDIDVYTTHTIAQYDERSDEYASHRLIQIMEMAEFVKRTNTAPLGIVRAEVTGDLNCGRDSDEYGLLLSLTDLRDTMVLARPEQKRPITHVFSVKTLDYVLFTQKHDAPQRWRVRDAHVCFSRPTLEEEACATDNTTTKMFSDHKGVVCIFELVTDAQGSASFEESRELEGSTALEESDRSEPSEQCEGEEASDVGDESERRISVVSGFTIDQAVAVVERDHLAVSRRMRTHLLRGGFFGVIFLVGVVPWVALYTLGIPIIIGCCGCTAETWYALWWKRIERNGLGDGLEALRRHCQEEGDDEEERERVSEDTLLEERGDNAV